LLLGLLGRDPWKAEDVTHFGITYSMLEGRGWIVPSLAGEPLQDTPPLYYWIAAAFGKLAGSLLTLHDAARLAGALFGGLFLAGIAAAASRLYGDRERSAAVLISLGCVGLVLPLHDTQPAIALLAAIAWSCYAFHLMLERPAAAGAIAGLAMGLGFLATGWVPIFILAALALALPASPLWRSRRCLIGIAIALGIAAAIVGGWLALLARIQPDAFLATAAAVFGDLELDAGMLRRTNRYLTMLPWFAWPAVPVLFWALWMERRNLHQPGTLLPLATFAATMLALVGRSDADSLSALPLLPALILLAARGAGGLRRGAANALDWFAMMSFTFFASLVWLGWIAMLTGSPERIAKYVARVEPGFVLSFSPLAFAIALLLSLAWLWLIMVAPRSPYRGTLTWGAGMVLLWGLLMTLWLPLIDSSKSYRMLAKALDRALPAKHGCVASSGLGEAQRASLHYFVGIETLGPDRPESANCRLLLVYSSSGGSPEISPGPAWRKIWEGRRRGDRKERFRLYRRD
jgi:4-amino-4-deoxy-L-arabinose transferase-like glycosyltransferase